MDSRAIIKVCLGGLVALLFLYVYTHWAKWGDNPDGSASAGVIYRLLSCIVLAIIGGVFVVLVVLPKLGDAVGTAMLSSGEETVADEKMKAAAKMAQGDYQGAIAEYHKMYSEKPDDPFALSEIAKIYSEKLESPDNAVHFLQENLQAREWTEEHAAFIMNRIADIHTKAHDFEAAKDILEQVVGNFPGTRHSANAKHKINELEQAQFKALQQQRSQGGANA